MVDNFIYGTNTGSYSSCSSIINGLMVIFGGHDDFKNQISIVESCQLRRLGDLPMAFYDGACNTYRNPEGTEKILLCFASAGKTTCHR